MKQFDGPPLWATGTPRIAGPEPNAAIVEIHRHRESPDRPRPAPPGTAPPGSPKARDTRRGDRLTPLSSRRNTGGRTGHAIVTPRMSAGNIATVNS
ncbi:MAG: hypothetical protein QOF38_2015 [Pseudonocardiales bacterium]|nr:hypothetical protein [Pseudonocardiales bacterium]